MQTIAFLTAVLGKLANSEDRERRFPLPSGDRRQALLRVRVSWLGLGLGLGLELGLGLGG